MMDHVAHLCAEYLRRPHSVALAAGLDQTRALIRDALDEVGIAFDDPLYGQHAVITLNLIYELARLGAGPFPNKLQAVDAAVATSALIFGERTGR